MQHTCKKLKDNWKRCFVSEYEAQMAATVIPHITRVYKCHYCHWWHLTSHGKNKLPDWVRYKQFQNQLPIKVRQSKRELKRKKAEKRSKVQQARENETLPIDKQRELYKQLNAQQPKRSWWRQLLFKIKQTL